MEYGKPARRRIKAFAGLFQKAAGSQGSALSRHPQMAKPPLDSGQRPESTKMKKKSASRRTRNLWKDRPVGRSFLFVCFN
ncbi:hypothetical protein [Butyricicoccus pullicaecorum]|uniref:hypothetical protein n=1 Tax=Butyricicoccus pullicaecorum TaxID=501571 RepID=UPI00399098E7